MSVAWNVWYPLRKKGSAHAAAMSRSTTARVFLDTRHLHAAEEPGGPHEEHADDQHQRDDELELVADDERAEHVLEYADDQPADDGPARRVDPAEERGGE